MFVAFYTSCPTLTFTLKAQVKHRLRSTLRRDFFTTGVSLVIAFIDAAASILH